MFRVTEEQLAHRDGRVRCGSCQQVFDGRKERFDTAPGARAPRADTAAEVPGSAKSATIPVVPPVETGVRPPISGTQWTATDMPPKVPGAQPEMPGTRPVMPGLHPAVSGTHAAVPGEAPAESVTRPAVAGAQRPLSPVPSENPPPSVQRSSAAAPTVGVPPSGVAPSGVPASASAAGAAALATSAFDSSPATPAAPVGPATGFPRSVESPTDGRGSTASAIGARASILAGPPSVIPGVPESPYPAEPRTEPLEGAGPDSGSGPLRDRARFSKQGTSNGSGEAAKELQSGAAATDSAAPAEDEPPVPASRFSWEQEAQPQRRSVLVWALLTPLLALLLAGQAIHHFRDEIAAQWPATKPSLTAACEALGCTVSPLRSRDQIAIEGADLVLDPAHRGLLVLSAVIRNRGSLAVAYPHLELTLTDLKEAAVARRVLLPADYAGGTADLERGIPAGGEAAIKLFIDASATAHAGYRIYLFYP